MTSELMKHVYARKPHKSPKEPGSESFWECENVDDRERVGVPRESMAGYIPHNLPYASLYLAIILYPMKYFGMH